MKITTQKSKQNKEKLVQTKEYKNVNKNIM